MCVFVFLTIYNKDMYSTNETAWPKWVSFGLYNAVNNQVITKSDSLITYEKLEKQSSNRLINFGRMSETKSVMQNVMEPS